MVWQDWRNGNQDIYAQRVNSSGTPLWTPNGVGVCNYSNDQIDEQVISDGNGGAIFCWKDQRLGHDIYAQRINGSGIPKWTLNGTVISNATGIQKFPTIATDGSGGAIITWQDTRSSSEYHVYTQRIDANGINQWIPNGTLICDAFNVASGTDVYPKIVSDGSGGAIIGWLDKRNTGYKGIYTQKINSAGESQWTTNGVKVYEDDTNDKKKHEITSDGKGGAILIWEHGHFSTCDIAIGAINSDGSVDDPTSALIICNADDVQQYPRITTDSNGNVFSAWQDNRDLNIDIYVMKLEQLPAKQLEGEEEDDEDDKEEPAAISFGWAFLAISIAVISVITYKKFKKF